MTILVIPNAFPPNLCRRLIEYHQTHESRLSGHMVETGEGTSEEMVDRLVKVRRDVEVSADQDLYIDTSTAVALLLTRVDAVFGLEITRLERHLIGCYAAEDGGHFAPHRDNDKPGSRHRQLALSVALNDDYQGGVLDLPELRACFRPPAGTAVIFECSQLHRVSPVRCGQRYAYLTFLYDEEHQKMREAADEV